MIQFHPRILILLILIGVCLLTSTIQAQAPELIGIANLNNGDLKSGIFDDRRGNPRSGTGRASGRQSREWPLGDRFGCE